LLSVLVISVLAVLCGADDFEDIADFGQQKQAVLARHLALPHGVPSADTFRRMFQHLDAAAFNAAFLGWVRQLLPAAVAAQICVDGQTLRGSGPPALHVVSALARAKGLCLAQVATAGKGQELAAIPAVLALLDLSGGPLVSLDALGCQPAIAAQIVDQGGHYLPALKQNQPTLLAEAERALTGVLAQHEATAWASHNTPVRWRVSIQTDLRWVNEDERWPALRALVRVETTRYPAQGPVPQQTVRYYLSSQPDLSAEQALVAVRGHWAVENQLHWHLDVTLSQDAHQLRDQQAAENLALARKMALNLLRADTSPGV
jgi:predicted transposase YbfD/YdcC